MKGDLQETGEPYTTGADSLSVTLRSVPEKTEFDSHNVLCFQGDNRIKRLCYNMVLGTVFGLDTNSIKYTYGTFENYACRPVPQPHVFTIHSQRVRVCSVLLIWVIHI